MSVPEQVDHLVVALLAVGGYSLQRAWDLLPALQNEGLTDAKAAERLDEAEVVRRLARAGYDRGPIVTTSMAKRLIALHAAVRGGILTHAFGLMREGRLQDAEKAFCKVKGVGPMVFKQFAALEGVVK
ncbi:MAG TPA: hypothetical protein VNO52_07355 [Methylomirabilota bacterium]|nr:hypothetical protein [Methylomirabilota bacterium]